MVEIRARSTTVRTNDNIDIIVPNSSFITTNVVNLNHNDDIVRFKIPVGVHYDSDMDVVEKALLEAAANCENVVKDPAPGVRLMGFGDSSVDLELRVWTNSLYHRPNLLRSQVNKEIWRSFKKYGIQIPYPQRDVHLIQ
ncbi:MAG: mechanosensitive ion channel [Verrucomicrobia bacterium]|nr:mechanosensitive ion channel [Verrucomicrobiota bacterium]